ncbi:hypothetical protein TBLA_0B06610 [Henningerozyma blattae CBS 6284]|uniref:Skg3/CAF120-like PH-like domain-containing protein n=1 Tax=Henningerozyma blattae (strain ATCC 34711 / CBS 6284 / DSM 70876 / NBRC 10599 / NRRL Y-10934 / UCD 77-7) TaxID=1071380 RepID=I2GZD2_HENB6|nr:hypothetical protein TBLA_0B06610 [Tetrapisispora blattae CBS 6284]CCH59484.1 hypothetical protein TBLA_0B06610 [Tetrapisispora blattae CBS 6284]
MKFLNRDTKDQVLLEVTSSRRFDNKGNIYAEENEIQSTFNSSPQKPKNFKEKLSKINITTWKSNDTNDLENSYSYQINSGITSKGHNLTHDQIASKAIFEKIPPSFYTSLKPLFVLLKSQQSKLYFEWSLNNNSYNTISWLIQDITSNSDSPKKIQSISLKGTDLIIYTEGFNPLKYKIRLIDDYRCIGISNIDFINNSLIIQNGNFELRCSNLPILLNLQKLCLLSIFECNQIFKSLTGMVIASLGSTMFNMHIILDSTFCFRDWCEIYIEGKGWTKAWCHVDKLHSNKKKSVNYTIKFFKEKKPDSAIKNKSELFCFISSLKPIKDIFFYPDCKNSHSSIKENISIHEFLESVRIIKFVGNVSFPKKGFHSKNISHSTSNASSKSKGLLHKSSPSRSSSTSSNTSSTSGASHNCITNDFENCITSENGLLIRPIPHNGVNHLETLISFIIPMMNVTSLYGRPGHFKNGREDINSLMFGLPNLPVVDYFSLEEISTLLEPSIDINQNQDCMSHDTTFQSMDFYSKYLSSKMKEQPTRSQDFEFTHLKDLGVEYSNTLETNKVAMDVPRVYCSDSAETLI